MKPGSRLRGALWKALNEILQKCLFILIPLCSRRVPARRAWENHAQNAAHDITGRIIFDQNTPEIGAFRFGKSHADTAGCGPIAVYNALLLTGRPCAFSDVIRQMEHERGAVRNGKWGANPAAVARVLPLYGARPRHCARPEALADAMKNGDAAIVMTWNDKDDLRCGAHFFAVQKTAAGYAAYNRFSGQKTAFKRAQFSEILANSRYLSGYVLSPARPLDASGRNQGRNQEQNPETNRQEVYT